jgi:hypothetical protein
MSPHGTQTRYGYGCRCADCRAAHTARAREYAQTHRDQERARKAAWYQANRDYSIAKSRAWRIDNPEAYATIQENMQLRRHNLTKAQFNALLKAQGNQCAACGITLEDYQAQGRYGVQRFDIDHDHACCPGAFSCGRCIRGLICRPCNFQNKLAV